MRQRFIHRAAGLALAASLLLAGCSGSTASGAGTDVFPEVTGDLGAQPTIAAGTGTAPSDLNSRVLSEGKGPEIKETDVVSVDYVGQTWDGKIFDHSFGDGETSAPRVFSLQQVVSGWTQGLAGKHVGDRVQIVIPPQMGYGDQDQRDAKGEVTIPKNSTLVFVVDIHGAIDATDTSALHDAHPVDGAELPEWLHIDGELGEKPTITIDEGAQAPSEPQIIVIAEGNGEAIEADDYVAAHLTAHSLDDNAVGSTYDRESMQVTNGPVGNAIQYTGMKIGSRAVFLSPAGTASDGTEVPGGVYVIDYGAKMNSTRSDTK